MNQKLRAAIQDRDVCCCVRCGHYCLNEPHSVHHRQVKGMGGSKHRDHPANLIVLCGTGTTGCHGYVHAHPTVSYRLGYLVRSTTRPESAPVWAAGAEWVLLDDDYGLTPVRDIPEEITA